jgi:site-specific DNA-cytosine methylase
MRYLSLFSGIEAATVAWHPLGWECVAVAEIEKFPAKLLKHYYPNVPNLGDVTKVTESDIMALGQIDLVVFGSPCFTAGHLVLCRRGLVPIEDVVVGDEVWTHENRWKPVTNVMSRTSKTVRLRGQGHSAMVATPDHPFYAANTTRTWNGNGYTRGVTPPEWVHAERMAGLRWATPTSITTEAVPAALASLDCAYLAGLYVGDGHIGRRPDRGCLSVILSVCEKKRDKILPRLRAAFGTVSDIAHGSCRRIQLSRTEKAEALLEHFGEHSAHKTIPTWLLGAGDAWKHAFVQGVLDTDGWQKPSGEVRVTTVSRKLAVGLRLVYASMNYSTSLGFTERPSTKTIEGRVVNQADTWTVIARRGARTSEIRTASHTWGMVRSVLPESDADTVYDITVADDHSFVCDGLVVHNCQDLSVAGKRKGLEGERSGLFFTAINIINWAREWGGCRFALWENVPGAFSSNKGADFAAVVDALAGLEGTEVPPKGWGTEGAAVGSEAMVEWSTLDAQWFGVAQRRRRVFALADFGDWRNRPPILLEPEGLRGDSPPSREAGESVAGSLASRTGGGGFPGTDEACNGYVQPVGQQRPVLATSSGEVSHCLNAGGMGRIDYETETMVVCVTGGVTHALRAEGFDASKDGTGRGHPIVNVAYDILGVPATNGAVKTDIHTPLRARTPGQSEASTTTVINYGMQVRRLTVEECEFLQGFPRGYTAIPGAADGPRYKALGNSMAVPVMNWIGRQIDFAWRWF